jgi:TetR/AcrR family transcriptional regulator
MLVAETRRTEWGSTIPAGTLRDFIETAVRHDALIDYVYEYVFDHLHNGADTPADIAEALRPAIDELLDTAAPSDWEAVVGDLIANAEDALNDSADLPSSVAEDPPTIGVDFLPVARNANVRQRRLTAARIMASTEALASEQPDEKLSLLKIADRAEVSLRTIFQRFGDKPGLLAAMRAQRVLRIEKLWAERHPSAGMSASERIIAAASEYLQIALEDPDAFRAVTSPRDPGASSDCQEFTEAVARRVADQNTHVAHAIMRGIDDGSIRPVDPERTATLLWAAWNGVIGLGSRPDALRADEAELRQLLVSATEAIIGVGATGQYL